MGGFGADREKGMGRGAETGRRGPDHPTPPPTPTQASRPGPNTRFAPRGIPAGASRETSAAQAEAPEPPKGLRVVCSTVSVPPAPTSTTAWSSPNVSAAGICVISNQPTHTGTPRVRPAQY